MLTANKLEKIIELEENLRSEYQVQLDAKSAEIEQHIKEKEKQQVAIDKQLEQIKTLSPEAAANKKIEQFNRELHQRCENLQNEIANQKKRLKGLQKDLAEERTEVTSLKQFDPVKMKKNLDASKKKLAEKTVANDLLQKSLNKTRNEKIELQIKVKELEDKLAQFEETEEEQVEVEEEEEVEVEVEEEVAA